MDYKEINRKAWNKKTDVHIDSEFYANDKFLAGQSSLMSIELGLFGDVTEQSILHLQCHFGQDSLSLARMGAKVTGVDISDRAIEVARDMNTQLGLDARFIISDVYELSEQLDEKYDIVFSSYGVIGWLPDMKAWAKTINRFLKPGGKFVFVEFHPALWMWDDKFERIAYPYFNKGSIVETYEGSYAEKGADIKSEYVMWNHGLAEVISSLMAEGLRLTHFEEYDYSPYDCLENTVKLGDRKYQIKGFEGKMPMLYSLVVEK